MSFLEEIREQPAHMFSKIEFEVLEYLERCSWGATIYEIARNVKCSFKSLYAILRLLEKNGWILVTKERNGNIGRPKNRYILRKSLRSIIRELEDCGCGFKDGKTKLLNLTKIAYPYSLTIFKRSLANLKYGECLVTLMENETIYPEFIEGAYRKDVKLVDISINNNSVSMIFKKT
jgi:predicted transcriptional regulator/TusA-related sulfurtransferase